LTAASSRSKAAVIFNLGFFLAYSSIILCSLPLQHYRLIELVLCVAHYY
jgi:hypothetical protein